MHLLKKIYWQQVTNGESYLYGSHIQFLEDRVRFDNLRMASGKLICRWQSRTNYQGNRYSPALPLLKPGGRYCFVVEMAIEPENAAMVQLDFINRQGTVIESEILREKKNFIVCPEGTFTYTMTLKNAGCTRVDFKDIAIYQEDKTKVLTIDTAVSKGYRTDGLPEELEFVKDLIKTV